MKKCSKCKNFRDLDLFFFDKERKDKKYPQCKICIKLKSLKLKNKKAEYDREYRKKNRKKLNKQISDWINRNPEKRKFHVQNWLSKRPGFIAARQAKYRAMRLQQTPKWSDLEKIEEIYRDCPPGFNVDHIVPLQGKNVRGLHVPWNLQIIPAKENRKKSNKWQLDNLI